MMNFSTTLFVAIFISPIVQAQSIQVPEKCAGQQLPCLVKTQQKSESFKYQNFRVRLSADSILKVSQVKKHLNFDLLNGYAQFEKESTFEDPFTASINTVMIDSPQLMVEREGVRLSILDMKTFVLAKYSIEGAAKEAVAIKEKSEFLNKKDLVLYLKHFFDSAASLRQFLGRIELAWVEEFRAQNEVQTKALMRSIASEEQRVVDEAERRKAAEIEREKSRQKLFNRTFER